MRSPSLYAKTARRPLGLVAALLVTVTVLGCRPQPGAGARLQIQTPEEDRDADVYVDGNYIGTVAALRDAGTTGIELAPGVHRVEVRKPGRFPVQRTIEIERDGPDVVELDAELLENP